MGFYDIWKVIVGIFNRSWSFFDSCVINIAGFNVSLSSIFIGFIVVAVVFSLYWKGGRY